MADESPRLDVESWRDSMLGGIRQARPDAGRADARTNSSPTTLRPHRIRQDQPARPERLLAAVRFPDANITSERRNETTVPQQQLFVTQQPVRDRDGEGLAARVQQRKQRAEARFSGRFDSLTAGRPATEKCAPVSGFSPAAMIPRNAANQLTRLGTARPVCCRQEFMYID